MTTPTQKAIEAALSAVAQRGRLTEIFFVACGGSFAQMHAPKYAVDREARTIVADTYNSAEFIARAPARLGASSLVVLCSSSGSTPETVEAARYARERGAYVVGLTTRPDDSPLAEASHIAIGYEHKPTAGDPEAPAAILLRLVFGILENREGHAGNAALLRGLAALPEVVARVQEAHADDVLRWAAASKREPVIYTMASGPNYGVAYAFSICILQEMQWIHSQSIHSGEYFHGPFEITDDIVPFIILMGTGSCRKLDQRALAFARKFTDRILLLDIETMDTTGIEPPVLDYLQPLIFQPLLRAFAIRLSEERGHPLTVRRYMWKMDY